MLFNSYFFLLLFLPAALRLYRGTLVARGARGGLLVLLMVSGLFYASWGGHLHLLAISVLGNFLLGYAMQRSGRARKRRWLFTIGVAANLSALAYFKYANFVFQQLGLPLVHDGTLPLGISFFTFQQIAFLYFLLCHEEERPALLEYAAAVTFFPHLVSGPLLRYESIMSQMRTKLFGFDRTLVVQGLVLLVLGLAKKVLIADPLSPYVASVFSQAHVEGRVAGVDAICGVLAYSMQLYFDFSGYSDMAIGLGMLFGIRMPWNFNSPYKAADLADFWRRWHISLSQFLRDFIYIPLGGNRYGTVRQLSALMVTMVVGGAWHGAGWSFIIWGAWHAIWLCLWHVAKSHARMVPAWIVRGLTLVVVITGWVWFRSPDIPTALAIFDAMAHPWNQTSKLLAGWPVILGVSTALLLSLGAPNSQEICAILTRDTWLARKWIWVLFGLFAFATLSRVGGVTEFLYANF